ncbi:MAG: diguanylate cyclase [Clostridiaceae bacterium]|nr:diguanylate cyclase [Clostridiaceae bacterium]
MTHIGYEVLDKFFTAYLTNRNMEATLSLVTEQIISLGTGAQEVALNKDEFRQLLVAEFTEIPTPIKYTIKNYMENACSDGIISFCNILAEIEDEEGNVAGMETRLTTTYCQHQGKWLISSHHMSTATVFQEEDEFFPLKFGQSESQKITAETRNRLLELMKEVIPGGGMGGYIEPGFPLYVINDEMLNYLGYSFDELMANTGGMMIETIHPEDRDMVSQRITTELAKGEDYSVNYRLLKKSGDFIWVYDKGKRVIADDGREAIISVIIDISDSVRTQEILRQEAINDPLTQILNRREGIRLIELCMANSSQGLLMMIDIDNFKMINDIYGHQAGDEVLQNLAGMLNANVRSQDIAARLGGDEFIAYLNDLVDAEIAISKLNAMNEAFTEHYRGLYPEANISLSAGLILRSSHESFNEIYARADKALYEAKNQGKGVICQD